MTDPAPEQPIPTAAPLVPDQPVAPASAGPVPAGPAFAPAVPEQAVPEQQQDAVLDAHTYNRVLEPRSTKRLPLGDGVWHQLSRNYVWVRLIALGIIIVVVTVAFIVGTLLLATSWPWILGGILLAGYVWAAAITPRQARAYAYQLRDDDLVFRRGILWQRQVAVPYGRMQLVDITHGPLDRAFGVAQLKLVTAAASTGVIIPGLAQDAAEQLRDTLVEVAESRRTGL